MFLIPYTASPTSSGKKVVVPVEFDDGDNGRIELDHIRLLPSDFPIVGKCFQIYSVLFV